jgi:predicted  nucleic acid-binding Zn-ribbon protein
MEPTTPNTSVVSTTKTEILVALGKLGLQYQKLLQAGEDISFTKDTINQDYEPLKKLREVSTAIKDMENPWTEKWSQWNKDRKSLLDPVTALLGTKTAEFTTLANEIKADQLKADNEKKRVADIKAAISSFTLDYSTKIAQATTFEELNTLHMRMGAEKSRKNVYQEFMPDLQEAIVGLEISLKTQKQNIKDLQELEGQKAAALQSGDDEALMGLIEKEEEITSKITETGTTVQEAAISSVSNNEVVEVDSILPTAPKPRRTVLDWEVTDIQLLYKKRPDLAEILPLNEEIDNLAKEIRKAGGKNFKLDTSIPGLKIYMKEIF